MFTPEEKAAINQVLKENNIKSKKHVFDLINQGGSHEDVTTLINQLIEAQKATAKPKLLRNSEPVEYAVFGRDLITQNAIDDMNAVMSMPYALGGALMPDGHRVAENKTPVGSVVVSEMVSPSIVGADISCSVFATVTDMIVDDDWFDENMPTLKFVLKQKSFFGLEIQSDPVVFDQPFFNISLELETTTGQEVYEHIRKVARNHFGTCGDGNHFLEIGWVNVNPDDRFSRSNKRHLAILSHFGSRAVGSTIANVYEELAQSLYDLPKGVFDAPLDPNSPDGRDYIKLMNWAGEFAKAGHEWLHPHIIHNLSERIKIDYSHENSIYSRHNSMWITNDGYVHRKGATPAGYAEFGVIPATMGHPTQLVMGLGNADSFSSASHGGGRTHSRGQALQAFKNTHAFVEHEFGVTLIGGDADEDPRAYKNIEDVMQAQSSCVAPLGQFYPKVVRMAEPRLPFWKKKKG